MRSNLGRLCILTAALSAVVAGMLGPAHAGYWERDHVYADSFGNLVIDSAAGYKRIIVGEGRMAKQLSDYTQAGRTADEPAVDYSNGGDQGYQDQGYQDQGYADQGCYRGSYLLKGRSYMYGFDEGAIPFQGGPCR
jgi:hypothetical protein